MGYFSKRFEKSIIDSGIFQSIEKAGKDLCGYSFKVDNDGVWDADKGGVDRDVDVPY